MSDTIDYIDAYFNRELEESEQLQFEARCSSDEAFAREVAVYISAREAARETLLQQKREQWKDLGDTSDNAIAINPNPVKKKGVIKRWVSYVSAACVILLIAFGFLLQSLSPQHLTTSYINQKYGQFSNTMDGDSKDSTQLGISEYKKKNYEHAVTLFDGVSVKDSTNSDAKKYAGLAYLQLKDYDKALARFKELSAMKDLFVNDGDILQATTLLQRDAPGDEEEAKSLLQKIVRENEDGKEVAKEAMEKWWERF